MRIELDVNGRRQAVDADPRMPLLWALRDLLELTGTKYGCGKALCGACTVHLDGEAVRSCLLPLSEAVGRRVVTIEGLAGDAAPPLLHPVQRAWMELDVPQCGFCQAGQIMSAAALLARTPKPSDAQIEDAMQGNLCRCGTYNRIRQAIARASELAAEQAGSGKGGAA